MLAALAEINPDLAVKTRHISFGMVRLTTGKMSSRTGDVITADWLIEQAKEKIRGILIKSASNYSEIQQSSFPRERDYGLAEQNDIAEKAAVSAIKYSMLRVNASSDIAFDLEASVSFDGDSGPYVQYTYARCKSVLRKVQDAIGDMPADYRPNGEERVLMRSIIQFPDIVAEAAENFAPNTVCTYLFHLAQQFNLFYAKHSILEGARTGQITSIDSNRVLFRLGITKATAQILKNGLYLLGIETLEQM